MPGYICSVIDPSVRNASQRSCALTVGQTVCVALRFFATGTYLHSVGDAENLSKNTVFCAIHKVVLALTEKLNMFVVFPSHLSTMLVKEGFYKISGNVLSYPSTSSVLLACIMKCNIAYNICN